MKNLALAKLQALSLNANLAHAWLFVGPQDSDKLAVANKFSQWLLCSQRASAPEPGEACGLCKSCNLFAVATHPDFCCVTLHDDNTSISIADIRSLNDFVTSKPQLAGKKVVLLYPAEKMQAAAANALLKTLEEPGSDTILLLLAEHEHLLLPTIVSRCQVLRFYSQPDSAGNSDAEEVSLKLLQDLHKLWVQNSATAVQLAETWVKQWPSQVLYWFELVLADLIVCRYTRDATLLKYTSLYTLQLEVVNKISASKLWTTLQSVQQARYWLGSGQKPNLQLILEDSLI